MSASDIASGVLGMIGAIGGAVIGVALTLYLQGRSESRRARKEEFEALKILDAQLTDAIDSLISHRAMCDDKLTPIDGRTIESTSPGSQEFQLLLRKALEAFPFPVPNVGNLTSSNMYGSAAISLAGEWKRIIEHINSEADTLRREGKHTIEELSGFLSEASVVVNVTTLIDLDVELHSSILRGRFSSGDRGITKRDEEYITKAAEASKKATEDLYESVKTLRTDVLGGSRAWRSFLKKIEWPEV